MGIYPRSIFGLIGILTSPLIHASISHLIANTTGILLLGVLFFPLQGKRAISLLAAFYLLSGAGTWLIGRPGTIHIGASGVIYSLFGYLLTIGIFRKKFITIAISLLVFFLYGGAVWGVLPFISPSFVSWEAHLSGFLVGIFLARADNRGGPHRK